jgi:hypothetical protein
MLKLLNKNASKKEAFSMIYYLLAYAKYDSKEI